MNLSKTRQITLGEKTAGGRRPDELALDERRLFEDAPINAALHSEVIISRMKKRASQITLSDAP